MEANFFRFAAKELAPRITGMRMEKIFNPAPGTFTIDLGSPGYFILHASPSRGFFFLSSTKPDNKQQPSGQVIWLRKRTRSHRILQILIDWPSRRMAWLLGTHPRKYLLLDLRKGISLTDEIDPDFGKEPDWPTVDEIATCERIWEAWPHITPPVRHRLQGMGKEEGRTFLARLQKETPQAYWILGHNPKARLSLWDDGNKESRAFPTALEAAEQYGAALVASMVGRDEEKKRLVSRKICGLTKAIKRVERDEIRLQKMVANKTYGRLLQANLYQLDGSARLASLDIHDETGTKTALNLNPSLTLLENMARFFARAKKGERGLPIVHARKLALIKELQDVEASGSIDASKQERPSSVSPSSGIPEKYRSLAVNLYRTSDGFLLIRGRNQKANHQLLSQLAGSHDYWFHAQDGPGAHVILKRDFSTQQVPQTSLEEAATIAALASWQKQAAKAQVICALVKNVRKIKGAAWGQVVVQQMEECLLVPVDASLEKRLKVE